MYLLELCLVIQVLSQECEYSSEVCRRSLAIPLLTQHVTVHCKIILKIRPRSVTVRFSSQPPELYTDETSEESGDVEL